MYIAHITKLEKLVDCLVLGVPNIKSVGMFGYEFVCMGMILNLIIFYVMLIYGDTYMYEYIGVYCAQLNQVLILSSIV